MVWKQDLAKLKQVLKESGEPDPKISTPKLPPKPASAPPRSIEEEDSMFLQAMGRRAPAPSKAKDIPFSEEPRVLTLPPVVDDAEAFRSAMGGLKGLKPVEAAPLSAEPAKAPEPKPEPAAAPLPQEPAVEVEAPPAPSPRTLPERIQLAAGMAVEVDGYLDLRGHTCGDALERLRERVQDGVFLGWRTFHVYLGPSQELQDAFLGYLSEPEAQVVTRLAQAPIPMGGAQAWILYLAAH